MTQAYAQLVDNVRSVRRSWVVRRVFEGLLLAAAAALALTTAAVLADLLAQFGTIGRTLAAAAIWGGTAAAAWRWVILPAAVRHSDDFFAALAEERQPGLGNRLINALQLGRQQGHGAPRLVEAIIAQGAAAAAELNLGQAVRSPALKRNAGALGGALLAGAAVILLGGPGASTALARVMQPWAAIPPFTWTHWRCTGDSLRILQGAPLQVSVQASGTLPAEVQINWVSADGQRRAMPMKTGDEGFTYRFSSVDAPMTVFATGGDGRSNALALTIEPRPRVESVDVTYVYPAYASLDSVVKTGMDGRFEALAGTKANITFHANKPLEQLTLTGDDHSAVEMSPADAEGKSWSGRLTIMRTGALTAVLTDKLGNAATDPNIYSVTAEQDAPPNVAFALPGRDIQVQPNEKVTFKLVAQDDLGLAAVTLLGVVDDARKPAVISTWPNDEAKPKKRVELTLEKTPAELGLRPGSRMQYWAEALDRNDVAGPGHGQTIRFNLTVLTPAQAASLLDKRLNDYAGIVTELLRLQRANRTETAGYQPAPPLADREGLIRRQTLALAQVMESNAFPGQTIIDELRRLAGDPMTAVVGALEKYRDTPDLTAAKAIADTTLDPQDKIIESLTEILERLNKDQAMRKDLAQIRKTDPQGHEKIASELDKLAKDLDKFLLDQKQLDKNYEKMPKRTADELKNQNLGQSDPGPTTDWKKWSKDSVDAIMKLPDGFAKDSHLAENVSTIFEEIEKKNTLPTREIATPAEEGAKMLGTKTMEDLEVWMPDRGDSIKWVMENPPEGSFKVPEAKLPESLQDMVGDLIQDTKDFDDKADDVTSSWGGNMPQAGWDIGDGPISSFGAQGKTGNQLPNDSEISGRSGAGRRGKASGQMVGDTSPGLEGRPTPARLTNDKYQEGDVKADKQLDPHGATGGGKVTGSGERGLQGGTPPPVLTRDMERLQKNQQMLREKAQQLANQMDIVGRSSSHVNRAVDLFKSAEDDMRDYKYDDAARKRRLAVGELRAEQSQIDEAVNLSLDKAKDMPESMRKEIAAGVQQALPEGYEDLVGAYYKALSTGGDAAPGQAATPPKP